MQHLPFLGCGSLGRFLNLSVSLFAHTLKVEVDSTVGQGDSELGGAGVSKVSFLPESWRDDRAGGLLVKFSPFKHCDLRFSFITAML